MAMFTVSSIIDGDTLEVSGGWKWNGETGSRVRPTGYDAAELRASGGQAAKDKLQRLTLGKQIELARPIAWIEGDLAATCTSRAGTIGRLPRISDRKVS